MQFQRIRERAIVLPLVAFVVLVPPFLTLFNKPITIFEIPLLYIYVFCVWLILILLGWRMTHSIRLLSQNQRLSKKETSQDRQS